MAMDSVSALNRMLKHFVCGNGTSAALQMSFLLGRRGEPSESLSFADAIGYVWSKKESFQWKMNVEKMDRRQKGRERELSEGARLM